MEALRSLMAPIKVVLNLIAKNRELDEALSASLKSMNNDFELICSRRLEKMQLLQELAYDIDDFIQGLCEPVPGSFFRLAIGLDSREEIISGTDVFKKRIKNLKEDLKESFEARSAGPSSSARSPIPYAPEVNLVGIEGPKKEIVELLSPRADPHVGRLSVISIVGCSGSGKTALARALYEDDAVAKDFDYKAWVVASDPSSAGILKKIHEVVVPVSAPLSNSKHFRRLQHFRKNKRYLVFVDDVLRVTPWKDITDAFHGNVKDSRIILTTRVPSVARDYSSGSFVYTMQGLDKEKSRELFRRKYRGMAGYTEEVEHCFGNNDVDIITDKCDGLPIALISVAEWLLRKGPNPQTADFKKVSEDLGDRLAYCGSAFEEFQKQNGTETTFAEMRRARVEPYENLLNHGEKECLLYASIFPCGHQINNKNLFRRLVAEGLAPVNPVIVKPPESVFGNVRECVRKLMDQHMVDPVPIRNYSNVAKRCRVHSIMLQFTIQKAVSRNLVSLIHKEQPLYNKNGLVRRLTVQSSPKVGITGPPQGMGLSAVRSVAIFDSGIPNLKDCSMVRVLDLEGCLGLTPEVLGNICGLRFLKYLSLRNTGIPELPQKMNKLMFLETLDTRGARDTVVVKLPMEVLMLPRFAHLFGKFELTNVHSKKLKDFFSHKKSQLHTLGGIAVHEIQGLEIVLSAVQHATELRKVKVWYRNTPSSTGPVTTCTPVASGTPGLPSARPSADSSSTIAQDPVAGGTPEPIPGQSAHKWNTLLKPKCKCLPAPLLNARPSSLLFRK